MEPAALGGIGCLFLVVISLTLGLFFAGQPLLGVLGIGVLVAMGYRAVTM